jgi:hypothetical protein
MVRMMAGGAPSNFDTEWVAALAGLFIGQAVALQVSGCAQARMCKYEQSAWMSMT